MSTSLALTAMGGIYLWTIPNELGLQFLFAYWGCTTVFLFWSAMIKETRQLGEQNQGLAFGLLDGGRGLVASLVASFAVLIFATFMQSAEELQSDKVSGLKAIILLYTSLTFFAAILVWLSLPKSTGTDKDTERQKTPSKNQDTPHFFNNLKQVISNPNIWLQGGIIICAYCGYKSLDNFGLYATQTLNFTQVESSQLTSFASYSRPVAAVLAGLIADRWLASKTISFTFGLTTLAFLSLYFIVPSEVAILLVLGNIVVSFVAVYALRGIYFALVQEAKLSLGKTGTAVGLISLIGYTPDIFFASVSGRILDANPGLIGFQNYFLMLVFISVAGLILVTLLSRNLKANRNTN